MVTVVKTSSILCTFSTKQLFLHWSSTYIFVYISLTSALVGCAPTQKCSNGVTQQILKMCSWPVRAAGFSQREHLRCSHCRWTMLSSSCLHFPYWVRYFLVQGWSPETSYKLPFFMSLSNISMFILICYILTPLWQVFQTFQWNSCCVLFCLYHSPILILRKTKATWRYRMLFNHLFLCHSLSLAQSYKENNFETSSHYFFLLVLSSVYFWYKTILFCSDH